MRIPSGNPPTASKTARGTALADGIEMYRCAESRKKLATTPRSEGVRAGKRPSWLTMLKAVE